MVGKKSFRDKNDSCGFQAHEVALHLLHTYWKTWLFSYSKLVWLFLPHFLHNPYAYAISRTLINHGWVCPATELSCIAGYIPPKSEKNHPPTQRLLKNHTKSQFRECFTMFHGNYTIHQLSSSSGWCPAWLLAEAEAPPSDGTANGAGTTHAMGSGLSP
jgi:hypothetical protein